jgi:hypothetical protein
MVVERGEVENHPQSCCFSFEGWRGEVGRKGGEDRNFSSFQYFLIGFPQNSFILPDFSPPEISRRKLYFT